MGKYFKINNALLQALLTAVVKVVGQSFLFLLPLFGGFRLRGTRSSLTSTAYIVIQKSLFVYRKKKRSIKRRSKSRLASAHAGRIYAGGLR